MDARPNVNLKCCTTAGVLQHLTWQLKHASQETRREFREALLMQSKQREMKRLVGREVTVRMLDNRRLKGTVIEIFSTTSETRARVTSGSLVLKIGVDQIQE
jgi:hypothetical protein